MNWQWNVCLVCIIDDLCRSEEFVVSSRIRRSAQIGPDRSNFSIQSVSFVPVIFASKVCQKRLRISEFRLADDVMVSSAFTSLELPLSKNETERKLGYSNVRDEEMNRCIRDGPKTPDKANEMGD
jgi:hypothetical protein